MNEAKYVFTPAFLLRVTVTIFIAEAMALKK